MLHTWLTLGCIDQIESWIVQDSTTVVEDMSYTCIATTIPSGFG